MTKDSTFMSGPFKRTADESDVDVGSFLNSNAFLVWAEPKNICVM